MWLKRGPLCTGTSFSTGLKLPTLTELAAVCVPKMATGNSTKVFFIFTTGRWTVAQSCRSAAFERVGTRPPSYHHSAWATSTGGSSESNHLSNSSPRVFWESDSCVVLAGNVVDFAGTVVSLWPSRSGTCRPGSAGEWLPFLKEEFKTERPYLRGADFKSSLLHGISFQPCVNVWLRAH